MTARVPMKAYIVVLPGVLGSVLQNDGKDLWAVSGQSFWNAMPRSGQAIKGLMLKEDSAELFNLGDRIKPTRIMADTHLVPGLVKIDGYTQTARSITDNFAVVPGDIYNDPDDKPPNFYHFPYDWRRDNQVDTRILKYFLDRRLECRRAESGAADAKVILLAHSMGGLVSRYYLEVLEEWYDLVVAPDPNAEWVTKQLQLVVIVSSQIAVTIYPRSTEPNSYD